MSPFKWAVIRANIFELWVGAAAFVSAVLFFIQPEALINSSVAHEIGDTLANVWNAFYLTGGVAVLIGLFQPSPRFEIAGLCIVGAAVCTNALAILSTFGMRGIGTSLTLLALAAGSWIRAYLVYKASVKLAHEAGVDV